MSARTPVLELPESLVHVACVAARTQPHLSMAQCVRVAQVAMREWSGGEEDYARVVVDAFVDMEAARLQRDDPSLDAEDAMAISVCAFHVCVAQCYRA